MSANIRTEGRTVKADNEELGSQKPNSYMTEQTIDILPFNK